MSDEKRLKIALRSGNLDIINSLFEELYNRYKGLVCFVIAKYVKIKEDIFDIAQDVFLDFFNNAEKVNSNIKFYLTTMAKNKAINHLKKYNKISIVDEGNLDLLDDKLSSDDYLFNDTIKVLKESLSSTEYEILILHLFNNYTFKEISIKLNSKEASVKTIYFRCLKKCRKNLKGRNTYGQ